ncbi:MAG TPA: hypothetical protein VGC10_05825 [Sphingomonas sp.]
MDWIGTVMGFVTLPMALFMIASIGAGVALLLIGAGGIVMIGLLAFAAAYLVAGGLERVIRRLDEIAITVQRARGRARARFVAAASGILPMLVLLGWELACFHTAMTSDTTAPRLLLWLWSYGVATGPWTAFAMRVDSDRRTICCIRAYAGHLAYWLLSALYLLADAPLLVGGIAMLMPAALPITVGWLLAVANREALHNVRI